MVTPTPNDLVKRCPIQIRIVAITRGRHDTAVIGYEVKPTGRSDLKTPKFLNDLLLGAITIGLQSIDASVFEYSVRFHKVVPYPAYL